MDQAIRNKLRNVVTQCRKLLEDAVAQVLQGQFGIYSAGKRDEVHVEDESRMTNLVAEEDRACRRDLLDHFEHIKALGYKPTDALAQLVREVAFTHLNRLCAYKMMEAREVWVGGQKFREAVRRGLKSQGFLFYLAQHPEDETLHNTGHQDIAYRHFLDWLGGTLSEEIGVLFSPTDSANRLYPPQRVLEDVIDLLNGSDIKPEDAELREQWPNIWSQDETIGWVYQYFTPKELRDQVRKESAAPRNSYELAFRNQFFTPRYVVEFLTDNTLGRIWYEMRKGATKLTDQCRYLVRRPNQVFLGDVFLAHDAIWPKPVDGQYFPNPSVLAAFKGDLSQITDDDGPASRWISVAIPPDQIEKICGQPYQPFEDDRIGRLINDLVRGVPNPDADSLPLVWAAISAFTLNDGGGAYSIEPWRKLWAHFVTLSRLRDSERLSQEELLKQPIFIPHRPKKDPRELKVIDVACGSAHFLLYCFDLLETIYVEAYSDPELGAALKKVYPTLEALRKDIPRLILAHNLYGIDIDKRATQIAALALWLRCQRAYKEMGLTKDRPKISRSNMVCAEPMPGEREMLKEFTAELQPKLLGHLVEVVFDKMKLAGEAGSLLKIEEELREAIASAKRQWAAEQQRAVDKKGRQMLFSQAEMDRTKKGMHQPQLFDVSEITEEQFWNEAESKVVDALRAYASHATNGGRLRRQLFAEDAGHGFAFVDVCQKRFDVVLMNPPFGEVSVKSRLYLYDAYENASQDVFSAFVDRGVEILAPSGLLGALTSRLAFFLELLENWRARLFGLKATLLTLADLGYGVLDDALVEAAAYVLEKRTSSDESAMFLNALACERKDDAILTMCRPAPESGYPATVFCANTSSFLEIPANRAAYWVSQRWRHLFKAEGSIHSEFGFPYVGFQTGEDQMFLRLHWEVPPCSLHGDNSRWISFAKGGEYSPFYGDFHLVVDWSLREQARRQSNATAYFKPGATYTERTTSNLSARVLPEGCVFSPNGVTIAPASDRVLECVFLLNTRVSQFMLEMCVGSGDAVYSGSAARHYGPRIVAKLPAPRLSEDGRKELAARTTAIWKQLQQQAASQEPDRYFLHPFLSSGIGKAISYMAEEEARAWESRVVRIIDEHYHGENTIIERLGIDADALSELDSVCGGHPHALPQRSLAETEIAELGIALARTIDDLIDEEVEVSGASRSVTKKTYIADRHLELLALRFKTHPCSIIAARRKAGVSVPHQARSFAERVLMYAVGVVFGRWDVRYCYATATRVSPNPLTRIPACNSGMLQGQDGLPSSESPRDYPFSIDWDGIMVDDPDHPDDIVRRIRDFLELTWKDRAEPIEKEACELLGIRQLRDYFRRPGNGGFWADHISRYSKSRRKAPIYWLLQSSKKNYALWLYYHRLDKDLFFKALVNYVEPKNRLEENRLESLRSQKGASGKASKRLDNDIDKQENFLSELRDFEDKLRRAADLHLEPDLNDGVVLNIAPLWELVPWREAKDYWEELLDGKYEWSSIGKQLREKGLVKC